MEAANWQHELCESLADRIPAGYAEHAEPAAEPTALVGLALAAHARFDAATRAARWLADNQHHSGALGVTPARPTPCWPTSWAVLLWTAIDRHAVERQFTQCTERATHWTLCQRGETLPRSPVFGHDSTLVGWSWAATTHSWIEPTALSVLALKAVGEGEHPRTREGLRLLVDRLLPNGGCNYGNTTVLGQTLLAHIQPTGLAMLALAGEEIDDPRIEKSRGYLERELSPDTATASLCYGLLGLTAHDRRPAASDAWLQHAYRHVEQLGENPYRRALIGLAAADTNSLLNAHATNLAIDAKVANVR